MPFRQETGQKILIVHGDDFDRIMPRNQAFIKVFNRMHKPRMRSDARPVHAAQYAKKWSIFYNVLRHHAMMNAVNGARENGFEADSCGHAHYYPEDRIINGVRYVNTGAWTGSPAFDLRPTADEMALTPVDHRHGPLLGTENR